MPPFPLFSPIPPSSPSGNPADCTFKRDPQSHHFSFSQCPHHGPGLHQPLLGWFTGLLTRPISVHFTVSQCSRQGDISSQIRWLLCFKPFNGFLSYIENGQNPSCGPGPYMIFAFLAYTGSPAVPLNNTIHGQAGLGLAVPSLCSNTCHQQSAWLPCWKSLPRSYLLGAAFLAVYQVTVWLHSVSPSLLCFSP